MTGTMRVRRLSSGDERRYDALIAAVGYEARATHIATHLGSRAGEVWGFDYDRARVLNYDANVAWFGALEYFRALADSRHREQIAGLVGQLRAQLAPDELTGERPSLRIAVDVSCLDRDVMAACVLALMRDQAEPISVDFYYSPGVFKEDLKGSEGTVLVNRPVVGFEGWPSEPDAGLVLLLGLGFESRLALAAIETLEPTATIALVPLGEDPRYDAVVLERNSGLLSAGQGLPQFAYRVGDVYQTIMDLDASVTALARRGRVVLVPLGPKPLALASMLIALAHDSNVTVWRMSAGVARVPEDRVATGTVVGVSVEWSGAASQS